MREARYVPAAVASWCAVCIVLCVPGGMWWCCLFVCSVALVCWKLWGAPQAIMASFSTFVVAVCAVFRRFLYGGALAPRVCGLGSEKSGGGTVDLVGTVVASKSTVTGGGVLSLKIGSLPGHITAFIDASKQGAGVPLSDLLPRAGSVIALRGQCSQSGRPGIIERVVTVRSWGVLREPSAIYRVGAWVQERYASVVNRHARGEGSGLIAAMVVGDRSGQSASDVELYRDAGLAHLSAVSGANVAIVVACVMILLQCIGVGPGIRSVVSCAAIGIFVLIVGPEPSVVRAGATGVVGVVAMMRSSVMEPLHALALVVIGLLVWDSDLAFDGGFVLSVAATAGLIVLTPLIYRLLASRVLVFRRYCPVPLPDCVIRAIAVAVSAQCATAPCTALLMGKISVASVIANVVSAPMVAAVTIPGVCALMFSLLPGACGNFLLADSAAPLVWWCSGCTWWIHQVARWSVKIFGPQINVEPSVGTIVWIILIIAWGIGIVGAGRVRCRKERSAEPCERKRVRRSVLYICLCACACVAGVWCVGVQRHKDVPLKIKEENIFYVDEVKDIPQHVSPGVALIVVTAPQKTARWGKTRSLPMVTHEGIPVLWPARDGPVTVFRSGVQHADNGRF